MFRCFLFSFCCRLVNSFHCEWYYRPVLSTPVGHYMHRICSSQRVNILVIITAVYRWYLTVFVHFNVIPFSIVYTCTVNVRLIPFWIVFTCTVNVIVWTCNIMSALWQMIGVFVFLDGGRDLVKIIIKIVKHLLGIIIVLWNRFIRNLCWDLYKKVTNGNIWILCKSTVQNVSGFKVLCIKTGNCFINFFL